MRDIFTLIASFVHRKTRSPGVLSLSQRIQQFFIVAQVHRKASFLVLFVIVGLLGINQQAHAAVGAVIAGGLALLGTGLLISNGASIIMKGVNALLSMAVDLVGSLALVLVDFFMKIIQYNDFLSSSAVANGWVVTRDIANMFFIVILLVIAFGTILGSGEYNTKMLSKLLVMAVVINFSRTIIGIMIDASQIIMLTFVNGFSAAGVGNFINAFGIQKIKQFQENLSPDAQVTDLTNIAGALLMGLILMLVVCSVMITLIGVMLFRIVYLWLLIVLSPIAWLMSTFPAGKKYYAQWWDQFRDQLVVGPAMAFFLWLSLTAVGSGLAWNQVIVKGADLAKVPVAMTKVTEPENLLSFLVTTIMLLASVQMAQKLAGSASGFSSFMKGYLGTIAKGKKYGKGLAIGTAKFADRFQAAKFSGIQFAKIPEGIKEGFKVRTQRLEAQAQARGAQIGESMRQSPFSALTGTYIYPYLSNPKMAVEQWATKGVLSRFRQSVIGEKADKKIFLGGADKLTQSAKSKRDELKEHEDNFAAATEGLARPNKLRELQWQKMGEHNVLQQFATAAAGGDLESEDMFKAAKNVGLIDSKVEYTDYAADVNDPHSSKYFNKLKGRAEKKMRVKNKEIIENDAAIVAAEAEIASPTGIGWAVQIAGHATPDAEQWRTKMEADAKKDEGKALWKKEAFLAGSVPYKQNLIRSWFQGETEAHKRYNKSAPANVLIDQFSRAGALGLTLDQGYLAKVIAEKGDFQWLMDAEGYKDTSPAGVRKFTEEVLIKKYKFDSDYAKSTMAQVSEKEGAAGNYHFANILKVDAKTGTFDWNDYPKHIEGLGKKFERAQIHELINKISVYTLEDKDDAGEDRLSEAAYLLLARVSKDVKGFKSQLDRGNISSARIDIFLKHMDEVRAGLAGVNDELLQIFEQEFAQVRTKKIEKLGDLGTHIRDAARGTP